MEMTWEIGTIGFSFDFGKKLGIWRRIKCNVNEIGKDASGLSHYGTWDRTGLNGLNHPEGN